MPLLWRYLLKSYFQVFALCVGSFISVLLVMRFEDVARFAASGAGFFKVLTFTLYQIPYILPFAIPVSCLISSILLLQRLSHSHELTAFRACGLGLKTIFYPLVLAGTLLSLLNFTVVSELAPLCKTLSKELVYKMTAINPLLLLQKDTMVKLKDAFIEMKVLKSGKYAEDVTFIMRNASNQRLGIMTAKELFLEGETLTGKRVSFISSVDSKEEKSYDHLILENQTSMSTKASHFSPFVQGTTFSTTYDYLPLRMIIAKEVMKNKTPFFSSSKATMEICRRSSLALAPLTFTIVGLSFGIGIGRVANKKGIFWAIGLCSFYMVCFLLAKSFKHGNLAACLVYLIPHPIIALFSLRSIVRISKGVE